MLNPIRLGIAGCAFAALAGCNENPADARHENRSAGKIEGAPFVQSPYTKGTPEVPSPERSSRFRDLAKTAAGSAWIGVIPKSGTSCSDGTGFYSMMRTDDEDDDNRNSLTFFGANYASVGGLWNSNGGSGSSNIAFCQTYVSSLPKAKFDYAVFNPYSSNCPTGSERMHVHIDNEDDDNRNWGKETWDLTPMVSSSSSSNSDWYFCFVEKDATNGQDWPQIGSLNMDNWIIWANGVGSYRGTQRVDDEDNNNENSCRIAGTSTACPTAFLNVVGVSGGSGAHAWNWGATGTTPPAYNNQAATCTAPLCTYGSSPGCNVEWAQYAKCSN